MNFWLTTFPIALSIILIAFSLYASYRGSNTLDKAIKKSARYEKELNWLECKAFTRSVINDIPESHRSAAQAVIDCPMEDMEETCRIFLNIQG